MAFEGLLVPFRDARVLRFAAGLLVVDKPPKMPVHGGDETLAGDLVSRLSEWLRAHGSDGYLGVHQRLDLGTSGAMAFATSRDRNASLSSAMAEHRFERVYVAGVTLRSADFSRRLEAGALALEHDLVTERDRTRVVERGGAAARALVELRERVGTRALVELRPETGKTHQLRVQLSHEGAPVAGDGLYGGDPAPRLLLHALELALDDTERFRAPLPPAFHAWLRGEPANLGSDGELFGRLEDAGALRTPLARFSDVFRLVNEIGDELPGMTLDRYGDFADLSVTSVDARDRALGIARLLLERGARGVYLTERLRDAGSRPVPRALIAGEAAPERLVVNEHGARFLVELGRGLSTGLFVDQRDNRRRVRELARGARVLNLFAYTSSFGVAAALGGAKEVVSVDVSKRALELARDNFRANDLDPGRHRFEAVDALDFLARAVRQRERFELVVLDPPSFASEAGGRPFNVREHYGVLAERALALLAPGGRLLAVTNHRKTSLGRLRKTLREAAQRVGRRVTKLKDLPSQHDCPEGPEGPLPSKSVLVTTA